ncbi:MAG: hypothetical protein KAX73_06810 [Aquabacterium sp.]|jgi:hypothetical protein|nr:hypothetical protein [Aquabacterium sp.]
MKRLFNLLVLAFVLSQGLAQAQERSNVDGPAILGNQELPKVLYIVPWKKPVQSEVAGKGFVSVVNEDLVPIDREVFLRQVQFQSQLQARQQPKSAP